MHKNVYSTNGGEMSFAKANKGNSINESVVCAKKEPSNPQGKF